MTRAKKRASLRHQAGEMGRILRCQFQSSVAIRDDVNLVRWTGTRRQINSAKVCAGDQRRIHEGLQRDGGKPETLGGFPGQGEGSSEFPAGRQTHRDGVSQCGFTPQYTALEGLYAKYKDQGLAVLGFPCNQFGGQEPGTDAEIKQFCSSKYNVTFPLCDKIEVNGAHRHPFYGVLAGKDSPVAGNIGWNFTKFLIGRDGKILKRFESKVKPDSPEVTQATEAARAAK